MNRHEANKLSMFDAVISYMESNSGMYAGIPVIGETLTDFKGKTAEIKTMNLEFLGSTKGKTADKRIKEEALLNLVYKTANALFVLGVKTKNTELMVKNKVTRSGLDALREQLLINKSREILTMAAQNGEALVSYGITAEILTGATEAVDSFQEAIDKKSDTHSESVAEREALTGKFETATAILTDELDPLMEMFDGSTGEDANQSFYDGYQNARIIKDLGKRYVKPAEETGDKPE